MTPSLVTLASDPAHRAWFWCRGIGLSAVTLALWIATINLPTPPNGGLDHSWQTALADAYVQHRQFGPDIIFTYGPWGFLALDGFTVAALKSKLIWELLGRLALSVTVVLMSAALPGLRRWVFIAALIAAACFFETSMLVIVGLLALIWLAPAKVSPWRRGLAIAWLSFLAHFKFVLCLEAVSAVAIISAVHASERRPRLAVAVPMAFIGAYAGWWLAAGQNLGNLPAFWRLSWEISSGYSWAMASEPSALVLTAGIVVLAWGGTFVWMIWQSDRTAPQRVGAGLIVAAVWLLAWKQGFTRADLHTFGFFLAALLLGVALPGIFRSNHRFCWQDLNAGLCILGTIAIGSGLLRVGPQITWDRWGHNPHAITHLGEWKTGFADGTRAAQAAAANPTLRAAVGRSTVDLLNFEQGMIFLNGLDYQSRPVIQSYSAYTPALVTANLRFFQSPRAPEFVVVRLNTIDGRYPGQEDALSLAELVRSYAVVPIKADFTLLRRRSPAAGSREFTRVPLAQPVPHFGAEIVVPDGGDHPVWMEVDFRPTWLGRLRTFFYHATPPTMTVSLDDGSHQGFRIISTTSSEGFFLRPLLQTHQDLAQLVRGRASRSPKTIRFDVEGWKSSWLWRRPHVQFFALTDFPLIHVSPLDTLVEAGTVNVRPLSAHSGLAMDCLHTDGHDLLFAHAPSEVVLPVSDEVRVFRGGCGFVEGAYTSGVTDGASFSVEALMANGTWQLLWQRTLEPKAHAGDRGFQPFRLEVPFSTAQLRLRIGPGKHDDASWDWTFWGDLTLLP